MMDNLFRIICYLLQIPYKGTPFITEKQKNTIATSLEKYHESYETIIYLTKLGFTMKNSLTLLNVYGQSVKEIIDRNVYSLINEVDFKLLQEKLFDNLRRFGRILENLYSNSIMTYQSTIDDLNIKSFSSLVKSYNLVKKIL